MRDYLEELLEEWGEEHVLSLPQPARRADSSLVRGSRGDAGTGERRPHEGMGPYILGLKGTEAGEAGQVREAVSYEEKKRQNPPVSFADSVAVSGNAALRIRRAPCGYSPLTKGAKGVEVLWSRLRRGAMAAAYRANTPAVPEIPERGYVREKSLFELDAAVRRDARRYDGEMTFY